MKNLTLKLAGVLLACVMLVPAVAAAPPANDNKADAAVLVLTHSVNTSEATVEAGEPTVTCTYVGKTVWYLVVAATPGTIIDTVGSNFDTTLAAFDANGVRVACDDDGGPGLQSKMTIALPGVYWVQAGGYAGWGVASGNLVINQS
ncbi:MAG TPA: hypothetical protein VI818_02215 [Candidatus Thermoplasmatota archaeon]|nr:hypothetical protein [Candidatus Thermoplasmatota archaeon]